MRGDGRSPPPPIEKWEKFQMAVAIKMKFLSLTASLVIVHHSYFAASRLSTM